MPTKKTEPTRTRAQARAAAKSFGTSLREWMQARQVAAGIRNRKRKKKAPTGDRGVDRYRVTKPAPTWLVLHTSPSRALVRHQGGSRGRLNEPYVNPMRDVKALRSGRLRKELRP